MAHLNSRVIQELLAIVTQRLFDRSNPNCTISLSSTHVQTAIDQGIGGLLFQLVSNVKSLPVSIIEPLQDVWLTQISAALARGQILHKFWPTTLSPPVIIKGIDLEEHLYAPLGFTIGTRTSSDWDLLIPDPTYTTVLNTWTQQFGPALEPQSARLDTESSHEVGFYIEGLLFELHRDPAPNYFTTVDGQYIWNQRTEFTSSWGQRLNTPSRIDRLIIWLINYAKSGGVSRLLDWIDFILILNSLGDEDRQQIITAPYINHSLKYHGLHIVIGDALGTIRYTPLYRLLSQPFSQLQPEPPYDLSLLLHSLNRFTSPVRVALHQVKYCHPKLRPEYIRRAMIKLSNSLTDATAT